MRVIGSTERCTAKELTPTLMVGNILAAMLRVAEKVKALTYGQMVSRTKEAGLMANTTDKVSTPTKKESRELDYGNTAIARNGSGLNLDVKKV